MKRRHGKAAGLLLMILASSVMASGQEDPGSIRKPAVQAHRGASFGAPENTIAAFELASQIGADGIETDVRMTEDHQLVLRHDEEIDNSSSGQGSIHEKTLEELQTYDYGSWYSEEYAGAGLVTLEECLETAKALGFSVVNLELKPARGNAEELVRLTADLIRETETADRVMISSFDSSLLKKMKEYAPEIRTAILTIPDLGAVMTLPIADYLPEDKALSDFTAEDVKNVPAVIPMALSAFGGIRGASLEEVTLTVLGEIAAMAPENARWSDVEDMIRAEGDILSFVDSLDFPVDYVNCHHNTLTPELVEELHSRGIGVNVWTPDTESELSEVLALDIDGVITNDPETALRLRDENGTEPEVKR